MGFTGCLGLLSVAISLILFLTPVESSYADRCGSILLPAKSWYSDGGELVHRETPPCRTARMNRLPLAVGAGVVGLAFVGYSFRSHRYSPE